MRSGSIGAAALSVALCVACDVPAHDVEAAKGQGSPALSISRRTRIVELGADDARVHPRRETLALASFTGAASGFEVVVEAQRPEHDHVLYSVDGGEEQVAPDGHIVVAFEDPDSIEPIQKIIYVWSVDLVGERSALHELWTTYYSSALYAASGRSSAGAFTIDYTNMPPAGGHVEDWIVDVPSTADVDFARARWGALVDAEKTTRRKARALAKTLMDDLVPYAGVPSDALSALSPLEQYRRVIKGGDHVWCDNFAKIFTRAAIALGIPARLVQMTGKVQTLGDGTRLLLADGHLTTEFFDEDANRWVWIDLTLMILGASTEADGPLTVAAYNRHVSDPNPRAPVTLDTYAPAERAERRVTATQDALRRGMGRFFNRDQRFLYFESADAPVR
ncbi:hypothetical protein L6R52_14075 [Myxococcota bacterium]|nr:hypothetical protein [Myxococcota bacterium]